MLRLSSVLPLNIGLSYVALSLVGVFNIGGVHCVWRCLCHNVCHLTCCFFLLCNSILAFLFLHWSKGFAFLFLVEGDIRFSFGAWFAFSVADVATDSGIFVHVSLTSIRSDEAENDHFICFPTGSVLFSSDDSSAGIQCWVLFTRQGLQEFKMV